MNKIVKKHYPIDKLPAELREGLPMDANAKVTVEVELEAALEPGALPPLSLEEIFQLIPADLRRSAPDIQKALQKQRNEWDR